VWAQQWWQMARKARESRKEERMGAGKGEGVGSEGTRRDLAAAEGVEGHRSGWQQQVRMGIGVDGGDLKYARKGSGRDKIRRMKKGIKSSVM
jgi:hypothetical protein